MVSLASVIPSLDPKDLYAALNFQDAYFHVGVHSGRRRTLRFVEGDHYQFTVLPFGLGF